MKKLITIVLLLLITHLSLAQYSVQGSISDLSNEPVSYAAIGLHLAKDSSIVKGTVSDDAGDFNIADLGADSYFLSIQFVGYQQTYSEKFNLSPQNPSVDLGNVVLEEDVQTLSEVTVTAQRPLVEQLPDRMVLNTENSIITKGNMVTDLLQYAPLVSVDLEGSVTVANRGGVLILVDGRQMDQSSLDNFLKYYSAEDILKIEVVTNPSAKYDASFNSVINIITKKSLERGLNGYVALNYSQGKHYRFNQNTSLNYRSYKWNAFGSVSVGKSQYLRDQTIDRTYPEGTYMFNKIDALSQIDNISTFTGIDFYPSENHVLGIRFNGGWREGNSDAVTVSSFYSNYPQGSSPDSTLQTINIGNNKTKTYDVNFNYVGKLDSLGKEISVNITKTFFDRNSLQDIEYARINPEIEEPRNIRVINPSKQNSFIAQGDFTLPTPKARWEMGTKYTYVKNDNEVEQEELQDGVYQSDADFIIADEYKEHIIAAYTSYNRSVTGYNIQLGLRAEQSLQTLENQGISRNYFGLFPSVGLNKSFKGGYNWGITYSRKIGRPGLSDLVPYRYVLDPYTVLEGNPDLKPQYSNSFDTYLNWKSFTFFANYTQTHDMMSPIIELDMETDIYVQITENLDLVHDAYAGINYANQITKWWQTNSNIMVSGTQVNATLDEAPDYKSDGFGYMVRSNNVFMFAKNWKAELSFNYNSPNRWNVFETGKQYWLNAGIGKDVFKYGNIKISFEDIFKTRYDIYKAHYGPVNIDGKNYRDTQRVRFSFSYGFGKKTVKEARKNKLGNEEVKSRMGGIEQQ